MPDKERERKREKDRREEKRSGRQQGRRRVWLGEGEKRSRAVGRNEGVREGQ